jgi:hypothetical protein
VCAFEGGRWGKAGKILFCSSPPPCVADPPLLHIHTHKYIHTHTHSADINDIIPPPEIGNTVYEINGKPVSLSQVRKKKGKAYEMK